MAIVLVPQMVVGILIPIAIIIGIGVILMKLFIIGFWFLGRGDHNFFSTRFFPIKIVGSLNNSFFCSSQHLVINKNM
jgi:hypothetical protein